MVDRGVAGADSARPKDDLTTSSSAQATPGHRAPCRLCQNTGIVQHLCKTPECDIPFHSGPCPACVAVRRPRRNDVITRAVITLLEGAGLPVRRIP